MGETLFAYCIHELRVSEDMAQRRIVAARAARRFPDLFTMLEDGAIHVTGIVLLAPHLTEENHAELLARARFRSKREIQRLIAETCPQPDVPAFIQPLGPVPPSGFGRATWSAYVRALAGPVRHIPVRARSERGSSDPGRGRCDGDGVVVTETELLCFGTGPLRTGMAQSPNGLVARSTGGPE